ncbi:radical SAM protein [Chloroflexota bacterium]
MSQADFVYELLKACHNRGIDTAIETCGYADWQDLEKVCRYANSVFFDIKHADPHKHKELTGVDNKLILDNLEKLSRSFRETPIVVRTPIVPGLTDSKENIEAIASFLAKIKNLKAYELLPYHRFGESKYRQLGKQFSLDACQPPAKEHLEKLEKAVQKRSLNCISTAS